MWDPASGWPALRSGATSEFACGTVSLQRPWLACVQVFLSVALIGSGVSACVESGPIGTPGTKNGR